MAKKIIPITIIAIITIAFIIIPIGVWSSKRLNVKDIKIDAKTDNGISLKIAHISDIHYPITKLSLNDIISALDKEQPDIVFLTGDIIDSSTEREDVEGLKDFFTALSYYKHVFAVLGNHETINSSLNYYKLLLTAYSIVLLENDFVKTKIKGMPITIVGLSDKYLYNETNIINFNKIDSTAPILLIAHRPEKWQQYIEKNINRPLITFAGHAHGGQIRVLGKGLYSPSQGLFPRYDSGLYKDKNKSSFMVVSRGLGDSIFPYRIFNSYHLPIITLNL